MFKRFINYFQSNKKSKPVEIIKNDEIRLKKINVRNRLIKLHFGCGPRILKGWINIDLLFEPYENYMKYYTYKFYGPKIRGSKNDFYAFDVTKAPLPLPDNSVDVVFHEDFIEHLDQKEQMLFLAEMLRVLKPGAVHRINSPNIITSMKKHSNFKLGMEGVYKPEWEKHIHKNVLSPVILKEMALLIGYKKVKFKKRNQSKAKDLPLEYRPDPHDRPENGNIFAVLIK